MSARPHVVIVGAGFGGLTAAKRLERSDGRRDPDRPPQLPLVPTAAVPGGHRRSERGRRRLRRARRVPPPATGAVPQGSGHRCRLGRAPAHAARRAAAVVRPPRPRRRIVDQLLRRPRRSRLRLPALRPRGRRPGAQPPAEPVRGGRRHAPTSSTTGSSTWSSSAAGPTGVEVAGAMAELVDKVLRQDFHDLDVRRSRVILIEQAPHLLAPFSEKSRRYARKMLEARGVEVRLDTVVTSVAKDHLTLDDGSTVPTRLVLWAAGVRASGLVDRLGAGPGPRRSRRGRTRPVDPRPSGRVRDRRRGRHRRRSGWPSAPAGPGRDPGRRPTSPSQILATIEGRPHTPFRYIDKGTMATIGRRAAVAELPGGHQADRRHRLARLAGPAPRLPARRAQPDLGLRELGLELPHLGPRAPTDPAPGGPAPHAASDLRPVPHALVGATGLGCRPARCRRTPGRKTVAASADQITATIDRYVEVFSTGDKDGYLGLFAAGRDRRGSGRQRGLPRSRRDRRVLGRRAGPDADHHAATHRRATCRGRRGRLRHAGPPRVGRHQDGRRHHRRHEPSTTTGRITSLRAFWDMAEMRPYEG